MDRAVGAARGAQRPRGAAQGLASPTWSSGPARWRCCKHPGVNAQLQGAGDPRLPPRPHRHRGGPRRRADHARCCATATPSRSAQIAVEARDLAERARARQAARPGAVRRHLLHLQPRHVRRRGVLGHHQPARGRHPGGRLGAARSPVVDDGAARRRPADEADALLRPPGDGRRHGRPLPPGRQAAAGRAPRACWSRAMADPAVRRRRGRHRARAATSPPSAAPSSGSSVAVVEDDRPGGVCLNWGCIPTKALLRNAEVVELFSRAAEFGITVRELRGRLRRRPSSAVAQGRRPDGQGRRVPVPEEQDHPRSRARARSRARTAVEVKGEDGVRDARGAAPSSWPRARSRSRCPASTIDEKRGDLLERRGAQRGRARAR